MSTLAIFKKVIFTISVAFLLPAFSTAQNDSCNIYELEVYDIECSSDSTYLVSIDFLFDSVSQGLFTLTDRNGTVGDFAYDSLPLRIELNISGQDYELVRVEDLNNPDCFDLTEFMVDCSTNCEIFDLTFTNIECNSDSTYLVTIDFEYSNVTNNFFDLSDRNDILGTFDYDSLPIRIEVPISGLDYEFLEVSDNDNADCSAAGEFMVDCSTSCEIFDLTFTNIECTSDSTYLVTIDFEYSNVSNNFFDLSDRNDILGFFAYDSLPIRIKVPISGLDYEFLEVSDNDNPDCSAAGEFMVNCSTSCEIFDLTFTNIECNSDSTYLVTIDFEYSNVISNFFDLSDRNDILGTYAYDSLPIRIEVPISGLDYEFLEVSDNDNADCSAAGEFMVDCSTNCEIFDLTFTNIECTSDSTYLVTIDFEYSNVTNNFFDLSDRNGILDYFAYDSLPIRTEVSISGLDYEFLEVSDNDNPDCSAAEEFMLDCTSSNTNSYDQIQFTVWPNPTWDNLNLQSDQRFQYVLYNTSGIAIKKGMSSASAHLDVSELPSGLYILQLHSEKVRKEFKIIKM